MMLFFWFQIYHLTRYTKTYICSYKNCNIKLENLNLTFYIWHKITWIRIWLKNVSYKYNTGIKNILTLILLETKVISFCHHYRTTSVQFDQPLYCWLTNFKVLVLFIPKNDNGQFNYYYFSNSYLCFVCLPFHSL